MADQFTDALSAVNQLEAELSLLEAQRRGLREIRKVITTFQVAAKGLEELDGTRKNLEEQIATLQPQYELALKRWQEDFSRKKTAYQEELASLQHRTEKAREAVASLETDLGEKEKFCAARSAQLEGEIKAKAEELAALEAGIKEFKKRHGLA